MTQLTAPGWHDNNCGLIKSRNGKSSLEIRSSPYLPPPPPPLEAWEQHLLLLFLVVVVAVIIYGLSSQQAGTETANSEKKPSWESSITTWL